MPSGTPSKRLPQVPRKLSEKAQRLWRSTVVQYELTVAELLVLESACREYTLIERLEKELGELESLTVEGYKGQPVVSGLVGELRQHRAEFIRQMKALDLPDEAGASSSQDRSVKARAAAAERWRVPA